MFEITVITLREGIEAFLIVAITLAYLRKTGRSQLVTAVYWGTGTGVVLSVFAGMLFAEAQNKPLWEGLLAAVAAVLVASMVIYMLKAARHLRSDIATKMDAAAARHPIAALAAVFAFVLLMITREGMETALLVSTLMFQVGSENLLAGSLLGVALAGALAWAWGRWGHAVNLGRFFQVTSLFLGLFTVQLAIYAFHEFTEAGVVPLLDNEYWHIASEPYGPEGSFGHLLSYGLVLVPALWLALGALRNRRALAAA